jgi:excisionase family DNA binding protein
MSSLHPGVTGRNPLAVTPRQTCMLLSIGNTHLYELIRTGELDSYLEGRARRITMESIQRRVARLVAENAAKSSQRQNGERARRTRRN